MQQQERNHLEKAACIRAKINRSIEKTWANTNSIKINTNLSFKIKYN